MNDHAETSLPERALAAAIDTAFERLAGDKPLEPRPQQRKMAREVARAIVTRTVAAVQAPTGLGKSYAYGVPAILAAKSGTRIVIATANKTLQDQLFEKDLPFLRDHLAPEVTIRRLKGISNYLCVDKANRATEKPWGVSQSSWEFVHGWRGDTETGELTELMMELHPSLREAISTTTDECPGFKRCGVGHCWVQQARERAKSAEIVVTNHHLFFASLANPIDLLGPRDVMILDEAHEAADIAREILGWALSNRGMLKFVAACHDRKFTAGTENLVIAAERFFEAAGKELPATGELILHGHETWPEIKGFDDALAKVITRAHEVVGDSEDHPAWYVIDRAVDYRNRLGALSAGEDVLSVERSGRRGLARFRFRPLELAGWLRGLWRGKAGVVLTSATLAPGGDFSYLDNELGLPQEVRREVLPSPFELERQALVVVPRVDEVPEPNSDGFEAACAVAIGRLIRAAGGGVLALFTATKRMERVAALVRKQGPEIMVQGEHPKDVLLQCFIDEKDSTLFGVASFWTGVDVPGDALRAVIIDRIPFPRPDDPVNLAMGKRLGRGAFRQYALPRAALRLMQGSGRLIRRATDRGVIVILDHRVFHYNGTLLQALAPLYTVRGLQNAERWFEG